MLILELLYRRDTDIFVIANGKKVRPCAQITETNLTSL